MKNPKVAVLLSAYNGIEWIEDQVDSIFSQEKTKIHLFISVDLSNDGTYEFCQNLAHKHKNITLLDSTKRFGSAALNFFRLLREVDFTDFDYIALADQDDIWNSDKIDNATFLLADKNTDGYSSNVTAFWPDGREVLIHKSDPQVKWDYLFESPGPGCTLL